MKNQFSELLSEIIADSEISKNEMIRACDIDRSSFFKFLNGTRLPTPEQLDRICSKLQFTPLEEKRLRTEYARITKGEKKVHVVDRISALMWKMEDASNSDAMPAVSFERTHIDGKAVVSGKNKVYELMIDTIMQEVSDSEIPVEIDLFLPAAAEDICRWIVSFLGSSLSSNVRIRHLVELPSRNVDSDQLIMDRIRFPLLCTAINPNSYASYYYYSNASIENCLGLFYPYSLITDHKVILINARLNKAIAISDQECSADYKDHFITALNDAHLLVKIVAENELAKEIIDPIKYRYGYKRSKEKPFKEGLVSYVSPASLRNLLDRADMQDGRKLDKSDIERILMEAKKRIGSQVYLIDEKNIPPAQSWNLALSGRERLLLYRKGGDFYYIVTEPGIVNAFYSYMEELPSSGNLLKNELAIELIDGLLARIRCENISKQNY